MIHDWISLTFYGTIHKILNLLKLKALADDKIDVDINLKFALRRIEDIVDYQHFLLFP